MDQDLAKAKADAKAAGIVGQTITIGTSSGIPTVNTETLAVQQAAEAIGLKVKLKNVSPSNYINFFIDPKYFGSVDTFSTINYGDYADPAALYNSFAHAGRLAELQRLRQPAGHREHERRAGRGRPGEARPGRDRGPEDHHRAAGLDPARRAATPCW